MNDTSRAAIPAVERVLNQEGARALIAQFGRAPLIDAVRAELDALRRAWSETAAADADTRAVLARAAARLDAAAQPTLRPVFNLTGTVLHTNLGRALLPEAAIEAAAAVARAPANLEYDLAAGRRGERDSHVETLLCRLTGAEAATIVNNNAAAVLLVLNTLARGKEVPCSRGELIEIGGAFRMPEIMARSGGRLVEIGTTNRTHLRDYEAAIGPKTGLVMKVHPSNYAIQGFTAAVPEAALAALCRAKGVPFAVDLGSGALADLSALGLPHEPTPQETLAHGADLVTFSGDKLLGGPQAGLIVGRAALIEKLKRNPLKRALRCDKMTIAALAAVLRLYADPERAAREIPTLRLLRRPAAEIRAAAERLSPAIAAWAGDAFDASVIACASQIGSGALPVQRLDSAGVALRPRAKRGAGTALAALAARLRALPNPVIGRIEEGALILDLRCLEDDRAFAAQLG